MPLQVSPTTEVGCCMNSRNYRERLQEFKSEEPESKTFHIFSSVQKIHTKHNQAGFVFCQC